MSLGEFPTRTHTERVCSVSGVEQMLFDTHAATDEQTDTNAPP